MKCQFRTVICSNLEQILIQIDVDSTYHNLFMKQFIIYNWRRFSVDSLSKCFNTLRTSIPYEKYSFWFDWYALPSMSSTNHFILSSPWPTKLTTTFIQSHFSHKDWFSRYFRSTLKISCLKLSECLIYSDGVIVSISKWLISRMLRMCSGLIWKCNDNDSLCNWYFMRFLPK